VSSRGSGSARASSNRVIELQSVSKAYTGGAGPLQALDDVSVSVERGELICFVGPSGCGKSTLLSIVAGLMPGTSGRVLLHGREVHEPSRDVGFMFQAPVLLPWRTVEKNVRLPAEIFGARSIQSEAKAREVLELVGLGDFANAYPRELSGGMQQRLALARVLAYEPEVLLMDEPFGALDEFTREAMNLELLRIASSAEVTVLFVTHNIAEAVFLGDRVVVMSPRPGRIAGEIKPPFPHPRQIEMMHDSRFADCVFAVRGLLEGHE
jgi:NitT/TauT family transport system ATP-binding protein